MAGTLVDFPEVMRFGEQEKNKGLVRANVLFLQHKKTSDVIIQLPALLDNGVHFSP